MEKFSYALEFYKENIFSLDNVEFFEKKVKEAEKIEKYFLKLLPNVEFIRPYIILSYKYEKVIGFENRIRYIRGLVYASDYVNFSDALNIFNDIEMFYEKGLIDLDLEENSTWKELEYEESSNYDKLLSGRMNEYNDLDNIQETDISNSEMENNIYNLLASQNIVEISSNDINTLLEDIPDIYEYRDYENNEDEIESDDYDENCDNTSYISIEEKLYRFKNKSDEYIENILSNKLKHNNIKKEDIPMIKRAMKRWFKEVFYMMEKIIDFDDIEYKYNDKNIVRYL